MAVSLDINTADLPLPPPYAYFDVEEVVAALLVSDDGEKQIPVVATALDIKRLVYIASTPLVAARMIVDMLEQTEAACRTKLADEGHPATGPLRSLR